LKKSPKTRTLGLCFASIIHLGKTIFAGYPIMPETFEYDVRGMSMLFAVTEVPIDLWKWAGVGLKAVLSQKEAR